MKEKDITKKDDPASRLKSVLKAKFSNKTSYN